MSCFSLAYFLVVLNTCLAFGLASFSDGHNDFSFVKCEPDRLQPGEALLALLFFWLDSATTTSHGSAFGLASFLGGLDSVSWLGRWPRLFFGRTRRLRRLVARQLASPLFRMTTAPACRVLDLLIFLGGIGICGLSWLGVPITLV